MASGTLGSAHSSLPTELVLLIIEHLANDHQTLCMLARTCRALQHLAEEQLYKTIQVFTVRDLYNIIRAFVGRRDRARAIHTLKLQYQYHEKDLGSTFDTRRVFNACVADMVNLREWHIESPYDNCHWDEGQGPEQWVNNDMDSFRAALERACRDGPAEADRIHAERRIGNVVDRTLGLAQLEKLTIHSHGENSDFWDLGDYHCLFRHPTLRHLHISCVSLLDDLPSLRSHTAKTPLTTLVFDECELDPGVLKDILHVPAKLQHLTLGENVWNTRVSKRCKPRLTKNARASLEALGEVAHSLETLTHYDPSWKLDMESHKARRMNVTGDGMRNFHALKLIQCETNSFLHQAVIMNHEVAPPNLETLRLSRHYSETVDFFEHLPEVETYLTLPSVGTLEFMQASNPRIPLSSEEYICDEERLRNRHAYAYKLYKQGINFRVLIEMHRENLIPPYLHGEVTPITDCIYDAKEVGFIRPPMEEPFDITEAMTTAGRNLDIEGGKAFDDEFRRLKDIWLDQQKAAHACNPRPETDQLNEMNISHITDHAADVLSELKSRFVRYRRLRRAQSMLDFGDDIDLEDPFAVEIDEDFEDDDMDLDMDDDMSVIFHEHNGELYIEVYESETSSEDGDDDEDEDEDEDMDDLVGQDEGMDDLVGQDELD